MLLKYFFNKDNRITTISSIAYFIFGILFCVIPIMMKEFLEVNVSIILLVYGTIIIFAYCISSVVATNKKLIISAILSLIIGVLLIFVRSFFVLTLAFVIFILVLFKFVILYKTKEIKNYAWYCLFILAIIYCLISLIVLVFFILNKFNNISMILVGSTFIVESISNILMIINTYKINKKLDEQISQQENESIIIEE